MSFTRAPARPLPGLRRALAVGGALAAFFASGCISGGRSDSGADADASDEDTAEACGGCPSGKACCPSRFTGDVPRCVDTTLNPEHCGVCGHVCSGACQASACIDAPSCTPTAASCPDDLQCSTSATGPDGQGRCCPEGTHYLVSIADFMGCCPDGDTCGCTQGQCPISVRAAKTGIRYLGEADLDALADELRGVKLATYRYKGADERHLGFIIDDGAPRAGIAADRQHVDLYGYTSVAVAALQVQARQIDGLREEVAALRAQVEALQRSLAPPR